MKPTQEQVIAWAREAGLQYYEERRVPIVSLGNIAVTDLVRCAALAYEAGRKDENEACAKVCESINEDFDSLYVESCVEVIRARREQ